MSLVQLGGYEPLIVIVMDHGDRLREKVSSHLPAHVCMREWMSRVVERANITTINEEGGILQSKSVCLAQPSSSVWSEMQMVLYWHQTWWAHFILTVLVDFKDLVGGASDLGQKLVALLRANSVVRGSGRSSIGFRSQTQSSLVEIWSTHGGLVNLRCFQFLTHFPFIFLVCLMWDELWRRCKLHCKWKC